MSTQPWTSPHDTPNTNGVEDESWLKPESGDVSTDADPASNGSFAADDNTPSAEEVTPEKKPRKKIGKTSVLLIVSAIFIALFVYSAVVQDNDMDSILWLLFYALSAAVPCAFIAHYFVCFPQKVVYGLCVVMLIYSSVLIIMPSIQLSKTGPEDKVDGTGDAGADSSKQEELIFEVAGGGIGFISALYHIIATRCCVTKKEEPEYNGGEEGDPVV